MTERVLPQFNDEEMRVIFSYLTAQRVVDHVPASDHVLVDSILDKLWNWKRRANSN